MRAGPVLLAAAALFAATHTANVLLAVPVWRFAEVATLGALLAYAVLRALPAPWWPLPAALTVLLVDAVRTLPAAPSGSGYAWLVFTPPDGVDRTSGLGATLAAWWAPLLAIVLLLIAWRRGGRPSRAVTAAAATAALLIAGYAVIRVIGIGLAARRRNTSYPGDVDVADTVTAAGLAVLPALALGFAAIALATVLARAGRRLPAAGACLLIGVALPTVDSGIDAAGLPYIATRDAGLFGWDLIMPTMSMPQPMGALTTGLEMAAVLLLAAGLAGRRLDPTARRRVPRRGGGGHH